MSFLIIRFQQVEMNDWMKTQSLAADKLKEMRDMIKQQMAQVRQVAQSAEFMSAHGPGAVPPDAPPASSAAAAGAPSGPHPQAPPAFGAPPPGGMVRGGPPPSTDPKLNPPPAGPRPGPGPDPLSLPPPHGLPPFDPLRPPPMFQPGRGGPAPAQALPNPFSKPPPGYKPGAPAGGLPPTSRPPHGKYKEMDACSIAFICSIVRSLTCS